MILYQVQNDKKLKFNYKKMQEQIKQASEKLQTLKNEVQKVVIWQEKLIEMLLIWLLSEWHILLEGLPGLAKTLSVSTLSKALDLDFSRVQFTPDLLPSDLLWTEIYNSKLQDFEVKKWPIFSNFILADEINRAPSKVQSALLEAMAEKHITLWKDTFKLDKPFLVLATQNPIEQSGTYNLPEAQLDRFMLKVKVSYPEKTQEQKMYKTILENNFWKIEKIFNKSEIKDLQDLTKKVFVSDAIFEYVSNLVDASRNPENYSLENIKKYISFWISPRWWLAILSCAKAKALLEGRDFVIPEDIKYLANEVFAHRIVLSYEALADEVNEENIVDEIFEKVEVV